MGNNAPEIDSEDESEIASTRGKAVKGLVELVRGNLESGVCLKFVFWLQSISLTAKLMSFFVLLHCSTPYFEKEKKGKAKKKEKEKVVVDIKKQVN